MGRRCTFDPECPHECASDASLKARIARLDTDLPAGGERKARALRLVVVSALNAGACHLCALKELLRVATANSHPSEVARG
jgi:hypothetical protein